MRAPRFITFISRREEIPEYTRRKATADFVFASFSDLGRHAVTIDPGAPNAMIDEFERRHREHPFCGVLNRKEKCVVPAARLANALGLPAIIHNPYLARDKYRMRLALNGGESFPRTILLEEEAHSERVPEEMFPCVLKPRFGFNSRGVRVVENRPELQMHLSRQQTSYRELPKQDGTNADFVAEDLIQGTEHTIDALVHEGRVLCQMLSDKAPMTPPYFIEVGDLMPSQLPPTTQGMIRRAVEQAVARLEIRNGWTHTEIKLHCGRPVVIECAARMGGGYFDQLYQEVYGVDRMAVLMDLFAGLPPPEPPSSRCVIAARRVVAYGVQSISGLENAREIFSQPGVRLIWPDSPDKIGGIVVGPPDGFNNTIFEFFARGDTPEEALERARITEESMRLRRVAVGHTGQSAVLAP